MFAPVLIAAVLAACSSAGDSQPTDGGTPPPASPSPASPPPTDGLPVDSTASSTPPGSDPIAPSTEVVADPSTTAPPAPGAADFVACAASMMLRDRIALLVWPAVYSSDWDTALRTVEEYQVGGVILMEPSGWGPDDLKAQLARLESMASRGLVVATDEEGGDVQRLALLGSLASQQSVSEQFDLEEARQLIASHGELLAEAGVDMVLGPVVDVTPTSGSVPLNGSRFFTGDAATVAVFGDAYVSGWMSSGLDTVLKHYPGHGGASGDTHDAPGITDSFAELQQRDLIPFAALQDTGTAVMVGHLTVPGLTEGVPATQSEPAVRYLREGLGYTDALVMTDALGMQAVGLPEDEAAVLAVMAGIDVVIFTLTERTEAVIDAIERAVADGLVSDERITESAARVLRTLGENDTGCGA